MLATVPPLLPGLINSINTNIPVGGAVKIFSFAWLYGVSLFEPMTRCRKLIFTPQFFVSSFVYYITSWLFPAKETYMEEAILADDAVLDAAYGLKYSDEENTSSVEDKASVQADVKSVSDQV